MEMDGAAVYGQSFIVATMSSASARPAIFCPIKTGIAHLNERRTSTREGHFENV
jgi:hypothetical protein